MQLLGPYKYHLKFTTEKICCVKSNTGKKNFSKPVTDPGPKLYVISSAQKLVYVGITKQSIRARLRSGFNSQGDSGYYGYQWRNCLSSANVDFGTKRVEIS